MSVQLKIQRSVVEIGLEKPIRFLHVTDAHIDIDKSIGKEEHVKCFEEAMRYAKENDLRILCTGDNFKGVSDDNKAYALKHFGDEKNIIIPGNHDFCGCPDNHGLDAPAYCNEYAEKLKEIYRNDIYFDSVIIDGVNFVTMQDVYYSIETKQIALLEKEVSKGYPIVLCMHIPLFNKVKADELLASWAKCAYMVAAPYEYYSKYNDHYRKQQTPTQETLDAVEYIGKQTAIKAIVAGHIHENSDGIADCGIRQITTAPLNAAAARIIEFI